MAAIDFPASPTANQIFSAPSGVIYRWQATPGMWLAVAASPPATEFTAVLGGPSGLPVTSTVVTTLTVSVGNVGSHFTPGTGQYRPPAGRYYLFASLYGSSSSAASNIQVIIAKNGSAIYSALATTAATSYAAQVTAVGLVDANGTDNFTMMVSGSASGTNGSSFVFGGYPIR